MPKMKSGLKEVVKPIVSADVKIIVEHEYDKWENEIKTVAYKEFAENIKEKYGIFTPLGVNWIEEAKVVRVSDIDKILKEMIDKEND